MSGKAHRESARPRLLCDVMQAHKLRMIAQLTPYVRLHQSQLTVLSAESTVNWDWWNRTLVHKLAS